MTPVSDSAGHTDPSEQHGDGSRPIVPKLGPDQQCHRCGTTLLMSAVNAQGKAIVVCEKCDADDPHAGPIICYFAVHGIVQPDSLADFAGLLRTWVDNAQPAQVDPAAVDAEYQAWLRGDL